MPRELWIVAGEPSGDTHGAHLLNALRARDPALRFRGYGGPRMAAAGLELVADLASKAIMGLFPVVAALPEIWRLMRTATTELAERRPAALLLIDYPGFNLRLAARARKLGIPVIYYISPQVWAWAGWRIKKMARLVDRMLVILPFEEEVYRGSGVPVTYVGHPLMDHLAEAAPSAAAVAAVRAGRPKSTGPLVGVFPGSRRHVVESLLDVFLETAQHLRALPGTEDARFALALTQETFRPYVESRLPADLPCTLHVAEPNAVMEAADLCLTSSGTTTLEIAASLTPFVIGYRVSPVLYVLGKALISVEHIGLVNLVAQRRLVPEHVGVRSFAAAAAADLHRLWTDPTERARQVAGMKSVRDALDTRGSYDRTAQAVLAELPGE